MDDGSVVVVEIQSGTLTAGQSPTATSPASPTTGGGPNGAAIGPDGKVYVCNNGGFEWAEVDGMTAPGAQPADYIGGRIQRVDLDTGEVEDLYTECDGFGLRGPNDIVFDDLGGFYFTDLGKSRARDVDKGGIYYATADGSSINERRLRARPRQRHRSVARRQPRLRRRDDDRAALVVGHRVAGRVQAGTTPFAPGTLLLRLRRLPAPRLDGRRQRGKRLRRHPRHRGDQRDQPRGQAGRPDQACRSTTCSSRTSASAGPTSAPRTSRRRASGCSTRWNGRCPACGSTTTHSPRASRDSHRGVPGPMGVLSSPLHSSQGCAFCA